MRAWVIAIVFAIAGWYYYNQHRKAEAFVPPPPAEEAVAVRSFPATPAPVFRCEGKTRCHEMHSCEEATFYLKNCPGVKIDGDGDGIPCERTLC